MGGEEHPGCLYNAITQGLPPRGRGRGNLLIFGIWHRRITPAWAGKSHAEVGVLGGKGDYPRVGGEEARPARTTLA